MQLYFLGDTIGILSKLTIDSAAEAGEITFNCS